MEVSGGASIGSTFLFQLFNIRNTLVERHRLTLLLPCRRNFVRSRRTVACIPNKLELGVDPLDHKYARSLRPRIRRHQRNGIERRHQRIDLGGPGRLLRDDDGIAVWLDTGVRHGKIAISERASAAALIVLKRLRRPTQSEGVDRLILVCLC
jgi:hypothetical protein